MDTSNRSATDSAAFRQSFILGTYHVSEKDITQDDLYQMILATHGKCKPYLKYFVGFEQIEKLFNRLRHKDMENFTQTDLSQATFPPKISPTTRCMEVVMLAGKYSAPKGSHGPATHLQQTLLFLSQDGHWILCEEKRQRMVRPVHPWRNKKYHDVWVAEECLFQQLDGEALRRTLERFPHKGFAVLCALQASLSKTVTQAWQRLERLKGVETDIRGIITRGGHYVQEPQLSWSSRS
jgi:hypothetical protein